MCVFVCNFGALAVQANLRLVLLRLTTEHNCCPRGFPIGIPGSSSSLLAAEDKESGHIGAAKPKLSFSLSRFILFRRIGARQLAKLWTLCLCALRSKRPSPARCGPSCLHWAGWPIQVAPPPPPPNYEGERTSSGLRAITHILCARQKLLCSLSLSLARFCCCCWPAGSQIKPTSRLAIFCAPLCSLHSAAAAPARLLCYFPPLAVREPDKRASEQADSVQRTKRGAGQSSGSGRMRLEKSGSTGLWAYFNLLACQLPACWQMANRLQVSPFAFILACSFVRSLVRSLARSLTCTGGGGGGADSSVGLQTANCNCFTLCIAIHYTI